MPFLSSKDWTICVKMHILFFKKCWYFEIPHNTQNMLILSYGCYTPLKNISVLYISLMILITWVDRHRAWWRAIGHSFNLVKLVLYLSFAEWQAGPKCLLGIIRPCQCWLIISYLLGGYSNYFLMGCVVQGLKPLPTKDFSPSKNSWRLFFSKFLKIRAIPIEGFSSSKTADFTIFSQFLWNGTLFYKDFFDQNGTHGQGILVKK